MNLREDDIHECIENLTVRRTPTSPENIMEIGLETRELISLDGFDEIFLASLYVRLLFGLIVVCWDFVTKRRKTVFFPTLICCILRIVDDNTVVPQNTVFFDRGVVGEIVDLF